MNQDEKDKEAKEKARLGGATKPGAVAVASEEAARLDRRIEGKRSGGTDTSHSKAPAELGQLEEDVTAKQRARPTTGTTSKPGAYAESGMVTPPGLSAFERDVATKTRGPGISSAPGAYAMSNASHDVVAAKDRWEAGSSTGRTQLSSLEDEVAAKVRRPGPSTPGAYSVQSSSDLATSKVHHETSPGTPGAKAELASLEDSIAAKVRGEATRSPGAVAELATLEDSIAAKARLGSSSSPGAHSELTRLEDSVAAKVLRTGSTAAMVGARAELSSLEDAVAAKVRHNESGSTFITPGVRTELQSLEDSVAAKVKRASSTASVARSELSSLEDSVAAKVRRDSSATGNDDLDGLEASVTRRLGAGNQGARADLALLEEDIAAKENAGRDGEITRLDERIGAKTTTLATSNYRSEPMPEVEGAVDDDKVRYLDATPEQAPPLKEETLASLQELTTADRGIAQAPDVEYGVLGEGLAVAVAVQEESEDAFIPSAVEYDPDAKPPTYKNRRFRLYGFLVFFIVVVVAIGASVGVTMSKRADEYTPSAAPTSFRESLGIANQIKRIVGEEELDKPNSPYARALDWITHDDPMQLSPEDPTFLQRFTAAYFYFATTEDGPWRSCNPPDDPWSGETFCQFDRLVGLFPTRYVQVPWNRMLSNISECEWAGFYCDDQGQMRAIDLPGMGLSGSFPEGIYNFPFLQSIMIIVCNLRGRLPPKLAEMKHLVNIELNYNQFSGPIPEEWNNARNLQRINVGENMITGPISSEVYNLRDMKGFFTFTNLMTGPLPKELGLMDSLTYMRVQRNSHNGTIPTEFGAWKSLQEFWVYANLISGQIPPELGNIKTMQDFRVQSNPMGGEIPDSVFSWSDLRRLDLYGANFTGTMSPLIGNLSGTLNYLRISDNDFYGRLPTEFANMSALTQVWLQDNEFSGSVPAALCALKGSNDESVLEEFSADCAPDSGGFIELQCDFTCCSTCCLPDGSGCLPTSTGV